MVLFHLDGLSQLGHLGIKEVRCYYKITRLECPVEIANGFGSKIISAAFDNILDLCCGKAPWGRNQVLDWVDICKHWRPSLLNAVVNQNLADSRLACS